MAHNPNLPSSMSSRSSYLISCPGKAPGDTPHLSTEVIKVEVGRVDDEFGVCGGAVAGGV